MWQRVYEQLRDYANTTPPPTPLILNGWVFSSASEKHLRWSETVAWAASSNLSHIVESLVDGDFCSWDYDEPPYKPEETDEFLYAAEMGDLQALRASVANGAQMDGVDSDGQSALEIVVRNKDLDSIRYLITIPEVLKSQGGGGLRAAASWGLVDVLGLLLDAGVDVNAAEERGWSALTHAAYFGDVATVSLLLSRGADIEHSDGSGMTPLIHAASRGATDIVALLLSYGADIGAGEADGWTAVRWADENGFDETVALLRRWLETSRLST